MKCHSRLELSLCIQKREMTVDISNSQMVQHSTAVYVKSSTIRKLVHRLDRDIINVRIYIVPDWAALMTYFLTVTAMSSSSGLAISVGSVGRPYDDGSASVS